MFIHEVTTELIHIFAVVACFAAARSYLSALLVPHHMMYGQMPQVLNPIRYHPEIQIL